MSVDLETRVVTAFFCVNDEVASRKILDHLNASCHLANHPMLLPAIVFKYYHYLAINQDRLRKKLRDIEYRLGQVQVRVDIREPHDNGHPSVLDNIESNMLSKELNLCNLQRAHNQSRYGRRRQTLEVLNKAMDWMWLECAPSGGAALQEAHYELQHLIATIGKLFDGLRMRDDYYNERIRSQLDTLSLLRAQRDQECGLTIARATMEENKLSSRIALAMRKETEDMKVLAHMGAVFLPANFLATLFGMNMFSFMSGNPTPSFSRWFFAYFGLYLLTTSFLIAAVYYFLSAWVPARRRLNQTKRTADDASLSSSCEEMRDKSLDDPSRGSFSTSPCSEHIILPESGQVTQIPTRDIV
ncbi:MAG: hypothetical protein M1833_000636 [Piccolia ochrophora]|nr:MAG: hypothetical protein M1833_000636 [Piccolia ochrophora]